MKKIINRGFTLVELLIVIALIAILSVAVLSTINPIEQSNKARDARVQNDAAEVLNAMERYYASKQLYPWVEFAGGTPITSGQAITLRSDTYGFGICGDATDATDLLGKAAISRGANCTGLYTNYLIQTSELKSSFIGKDQFEAVRSDAKPEQAMWVAKGLNSDSIYLCYVPKAKANRDDLAKLRCVTNDGQVQKLTEGAGPCAAPAADGSDWAADPAELGPGGPDGSPAGMAAPIAAVFKCIPE